MTETIIQGSLNTQLYVFPYSLTVYAYIFQKSTSLQYVNLRGNGFHVAGSEALANALESNTVLEELDLSNNRINTHCLDTLLHSLKKNTKLKTLKVPGISTKFFLNSYVHCVSDFMMIRTLVLLFSSDQSVTICHLLHFL